MIWNHTTFFKSNSFISNNIISNNTISFQIICEECLAHARVTVVQEEKPAERKSCSTLIRHHSFLWCSVTHGRLVYESARGCIHLCKTLTYIIVGGNKWCVAILEQATLQLVPYLCLPLQLYRHSRGEDHRADYSRGSYSTRSSRACLSRWGRSFQRHHSHTGIELLVGV